VDDVVVVLKDLQPAAIIVAAVAIVALVSRMLNPRIGPWAGLLTIAGVTVYVGNRVRDVDPRPAWLLPLALAGLLVAVMAGYRLWKAIHATSNNDHTIGYVFPTAVAVVSLWLSIALIEFDASGLGASIVG
jgi:F0F1-type ATP synthase membrane subunit c/vacuolar-type H+-ATPase subunit K